MPTTGRLMPHLALGTLSALSVGALVLSLVQSTPVAPRQVHLAAAGTAAASSFAIQETIQQVASGRVARQQTIVEKYQAPDRIEVTNSGVTERVIGTTGYASTDGGATWTKLAQPVDARQAVPVLLAPLRFVERASNVKASSGQDRFTYVAPLGDFITSLHLAIGGSFPRTAVPMVVSVSGEFLTGMTAHFAFQGKQYVLRIGYSQIDTLPELVAPTVAGG